MTPADEPWQYIYLRIADAIAERITTGHYQTRLPAERDLASEFGVSYITARHATKVLRERGLIITVHGKGTFVAPRTPGTT